MNMRKYAFRSVGVMMELFLLVFVLLFSSVVTFDFHVVPAYGEGAGGAITVGTCGQGTYASIYSDIITYITPFPDLKLMYYNISAGGPPIDTGISYCYHPAVYEDTIVCLPNLLSEIWFYSISAGAVTQTIPIEDFIKSDDLIVWGKSYPSRVLSIYGNITAFYDYRYYDIPPPGPGPEDEQHVRIWCSIAGGGFIKIAEEIFMYPHDIKGWGVSVYGDTVAFTQEGVLKYHNTTTGTTTNTGLTGMCPSIYEDIIAFQSGSVIMYYNMTSGTATNTGQVGWGPYIYGTCGIHMTIAYNASGIIMTYDVKTGNATNTGEAGVAPSMGYGGTVVFVVRDTEFWWVKFLPNLTLCRLVPIQVIWENKVPAGEARALTVDKKTVVWVEVFSTFPFPVKTSIRIIYDFGRRVYYECGPGGVLCAEQLVVNPGWNEFYIPGGPRNPPHPGLAVRPFPPRPLPAINPPPNNLFNTNPVWIDPNTEPPDAGPWLFWTRAGFDGNIRAMVDPWGGPTPIAFPGKIREANEWDNEGVTGKKFVECKPLRILYLPISFPADPARGIAADPAFINIPQIISRANEFVMATYPVADNRFSSGLSWSLQAWVNALGLVRLVPPPAWLRNQAGAYFLLGAPASRIAAIFGYDRAVILVPRRNALPVGRVGGAWLDTWFEIGTSWGISWLNNVDEVPVFVEDTFWTTVAHELGHTYYLWHPGDVGPLRTWTQLGTQC